ncbi:MAG: right-handed parallel beta-helix repeat-containing protein [Planctomycetes bacterium]|nr:right-handed parallel beta-helix repeat-containing protein [Planctomycetota bacterium]
MATAPVGLFTGPSNVTIQAMIDAAAGRGGGVVRVPAGVYMLNDAVHLRPGVRVVGAGRGATVLKKIPSIASRITDYLGYGHYEFTVDEPEKFHAGMGVHIYDKSAFGFYTTVATVIEKRGRLLFINRPLAHDYSGGNGGFAVSAFSCVEGEHADDASLEDLTLDGNSEEETVNLTGCRGGGVFLIMCNRVALRGVEVRSFRGDAVSFQQCTDITVESCDIHHNSNSGLHPGSGTVRYVMRRNHSHHNGTFGLFYCLRTSHSLCEENTLEHNGESGISVGERDTDHLIQHNTVRHNGGPAIEFRPVNHEGGDRVRIVGNTLGPDCATRGGAEVMIPARLRDIHMEGNTFTVPPGRSAVSLKPGCERVSFVGNTVDGRSQQAGDVVVPAESPDDPKATWDKPNQGSIPALGPATDVLLHAPTPLPPVGPAALPLDGAKHLSIDRLSAWNKV